MPARRLKSSGDPVIPIGIPDATLPLACCCSRRTAGTIHRFDSANTHSSVASSTASLVFQGTPLVVHLGLVQPIDRLGRRVDIRIAGAAYRGLDAGFAQTLGVADADVSPVVRPQGFDVGAGRS